VSDTGVGWTGLPWGRLAEVAGVLALIGAGIAAYVQTQSELSDQRAELTILRANLASLAAEDTDLSQQLTRLETEFERVRVRVDTNVSSVEELASQSFVLAGQYANDFGNLVVRVERLASRLNSLSTSDQDTSNGISLNGDAFDAAQQEIGDLQNLLSSVSARLELVERNSSSFLLRSEADQAFLSYGDQVRLRNASGYIRGENHERAERDVVMSGGGDARSLFTLER